MLSYRIIGDGPPLLLIHGWGVTRSVWGQLEARLAGHVRLIQVELPGLGGSPPPGAAYGAGAAEELRALRKELGIERWTVLGYSAGAGICSRYVRRDLPHVQGVIFLCPLLPLGVFPMLEALRRGLARVSPVPQTWLLTGWRLHWSLRILVFNTVRGARVEPWYREISEQPRDALLAHFDDLFDDHWDRLPRSLPTLRIWGRRDRIAARPKRVHPHDQVIDAAHSAPLGSAEEIARELLAFLRRIEAPTRPATARPAPWPGTLLPCPSGPRCQDCADAAPGSGHVS